MVIHGVLIGRRRYLQVALGLGLCLSLSNALTDPYVRVACASEQPGEQHIPGHWVEPTESGLNRGALVILISRSRC